MQYLLATGYNIKHSQCLQFTKEVTMLFALQEYFLLDLKKPSIFIHYHKTYQYSIIYFFNKVEEQSLYSIYTTYIKEHKNMFQKQCIVSPA